ncbi:peptidoglycan-binding domain-containing protein [Paracoccus shanxieyensis]|uniref:Peptidoglycan-binding protein n=1 Tax=Paracoccus shanxieyensis TaxID=2675752 RepID=A0A6L6J1I0_9RHOB|nr:peptidoglycan-binding domain-containing protein [Paracoccus shanxieyensis]MTH66595.1 peptidoglycan-binding protein [Paracoccus shanxieyensis]MTH89830.1 peptidoglycan-binding protein [Paracoccus shanxieyensis]
MLLLVALAGAGQASAENRAVVVGNADYRDAPDLAGSDTGALAAAIRAAGFVTAEGVDQDSGDLRRTLDLLARADQTPGARIVSLSGRFLNDGAETWFMGIEAIDPDQGNVGSQGTPLSLVLQVMGNAMPGAVLLLGTDDQDMAHRPDLQNGIGPLAPAAGVSIVTGPPEGTAAALRALAAGKPLGEAVAAHPGLTLLPDSDAALTPASPAAAAAAMVTAPSAEPTDSDRSAWSEAAGQDVPESYTTYLRRYPSGQFSEAATARRQQLLTRRATDIADRATWSTVTAQNRMSGYEAYLKQFPDGRYVAPAKRRLAELRLANMPKAAPPPPKPPAPPTPAEVEIALNLTRGDRAVIERGLSRLGYEPDAAEDDFGPDTRAALRTWQGLNNFMPSGYLNQPQLRALRDQVAALDGDDGRRDRAYWLQTGARRDEQGLRDYLKRYPSGRYAAEAKRQLTAPVARPITDPVNRDDASAWRWARRQDSAAAYNIYLERFLAGAHADEARQRRDALLAGIEAARREEDALALSQATRRDIEERLMAAQLTPGPVDGRFTAATRQALREYQASRNLRVTGYVSQQTLSILMSEQPRPSR